MIRFCSSHDSTVFDAIDSARLMNRPMIWLCSTLSTPFNFWLDSIWPKICQIFTHDLTLFDTIDTVWLYRSTLSHFLTHDFTLFDYDSAHISFIFDPWFESVWDNRPHSTHESSNVSFLFDPWLDSVLLYRPRSTLNWTLFDPWFIPVGPITRPCSILLTLFNSIDPLNSFFLTHELTLLDYIDPHWLTVWPCLNHDLNLFYSIDPVQLIICPCSTHYLSQFDAWYVTIRIYRHWLTLPIFIGSSFDHIRAMIWPSSTRDPVRLMIWPMFFYLSVRPMIRSCLTLSILLDSWFHPRFVSVRPMIRLYLTLSTLFDTWVEQLFVSVWPTIRLCCFLSTPFHSWLEPVSPMIWAFLIVSTLCGSIDPLSLLFRSISTHVLTLFDTNDPVQPMMPPIFCFDSWFHPCFDSTHVLFPPMFCFHSCFVSTLFDIKIPIRLINWPLFCFCSTHYLTLFYSIDPVWLLIWPCLTHNSS